MSTLSPGEEAAVQRLVDARADQGLPPTVKDPKALDLIAGLFLDARRERQPKKSQSKKN